MTTTNLTSLLPSTTLANSAATTYTDMNGLAALKKDPNSPESLDAVAKQIEAMFLQMMLKSMREAKLGDDNGNNEMSMYEDMFDKQIALTISQHQDLGIGALLRRQMKGRTSNPGQPAAGADPLGGALGGASGAAGGATTGVTGTALRPAAQDGTQTPAEFVSRVYPAMEQAAAELGLDPRGLLAQAALESGWGRRMPQTASGASSNNLFGIKAGDDWQGARATADTIEFSNGIATPRRTTFRAYASLEDSVRDFARLLKNSPRYRDAVAAGGDLKAYVQKLGASGYATDPEYANKLNRILDSGTLQASLLPPTAAL